MGKSSLTNALVGEKVAIVSNKAQTTRNRIYGVVNRDDTQFILLDTPGLHKPKSALGDYMVKVVTSALTDEFGRKTDTLDVAAYYLDENGNLRMADVTLSEDGKQYTFLMTKYGPFALSARAVVNDDAPEESKPTDTDAPSTDKPAVSGVVVGVVIACVVVVIAAAAIVIVVLGKKKNAPKA